MTGPSEASTPLVSIVSPVPHGPMATSQMAWVPHSARPTTRTWGKAPAPSAFFAMVRLSFATVSVVSREPMAATPSGADTRRSPAGRGQIGVLRLSPPVRWEFVRGGRQSVSPWQTTPGNATATQYARSFSAPAQGHPARHKPPVWRRVLVPSDLTWPIFGRLSDDGGCAPRSHRRT